MKNCYKESVKETNILQTTKRKKAKWIGHVLHKNYLIKHITEGNVERRLEVTGRRGRRQKKLLDDFMEERGYCQLKSYYVEKSLLKRYGPVLNRPRDDDDEDDLMCKIQQYDTRLRCIFCV